MGDLLNGGVIKLERPLAPGVTRIGANDPMFSELAGVLCGVKPVIFTDCAPQKIKGLRSLCEKLQLKILHMEEFLGKKGKSFNEEKKMFLIGRSAKTLSAAALAWGKSPIDEEWGCMLGYPSCCVKRYSERAYDKWKRKRSPDIINRILLNTRKHAQLDFRLNNVWNYFSRMNFNDRKDCLDYKKFMGLNSSHEMSFKNVISWHPCAYDCAESIRRAGEVFSFMKHYASGYALALKTALAKPVLFWGKFQYMFFNGCVTGKCLRYKSVAFPRSLLDPKLYKLIGCCDSVELACDKITFSRAGTSSFSSRLLKPVLLNFVKSE